MTSKEALEKLEHYTDSQSRKSIDYAWYGNIYQTEINIIKQDLERLEQSEKENQELKEENSKLKKIIKDYCYIDNFDNGEIIRMCCESYEESNSKDFEYLKGVLENE